MKWFRHPIRPHHLAVSMIGAKAGDRVLVASAGDGRLAAELGLATGLNGRTLVVDAAAGAAERVEAAAAEAGALVEFTAAPASSIPEPDASFDLVVFNHTIGPLSGWDRASSGDEARRLLRPGGRIIAIERTRRPGLFGLASPAEGPKASGRELVDVAQTAGFKAARILSEAEGLVFVEATKARTS